MTEKTTTKGLDALDRRPFLVHCGGCRHEWAAAYLPMSMDKVATILGRVACPSCGETKRIYCGPAAREPS